MVDEELEASRGTAREATIDIFACGYNLSSRAVSGCGKRPARKQVRAVPVSRARERSSGEGWVADRCVPEIFDRNFVQHGKLVINR